MPGARPWKRPDARSAKLEPVCRFLLSPGVTSETITLYCGKVDANGVGGFHGLEAEHEDIRVFAVPTDEAFRWLDEGRFANATALVAMQWFRHHHEELSAAGGGADRRMID